MGSSGVSVTRSPAGSTGIQESLILVQGLPLILCQRMTDLRAGNANPILLHGKGKPMISPRSVRLLLSGALLLAMASASAAPITLGVEGTAYTFDPATMALEKSTGQGALPLSAPSANPLAVQNLAAEGASAAWEAPDRGLRFSCRVTPDGAFELNVTGEANSTITWPVGEVAAGEQLILARDSGLLVSPADPFWRQQLIEEEWNTLESLSMPVWGVLDGERCVSWMISTPFRNQIDFREATKPDGLAFTLSHEFHEMSPQREITIRVMVDEDAMPVTPGLRYREWLDATAGVTTLREKAAAVPAVERLLGAPHVYLWGDAPLSWLDIPTAKWKPFCTRLIAAAEVEGSFAARLKKQFNAEQWNAVLECVETEWPYEYMKRQIAEGLSVALQSPELDDHAASSEAERIQRNSRTLAEAFPGTFLPPEDWGNGVSLKMIRALEQRGFDRLRLCVPGVEGIASKPQVATEAEQRGWLMGTYDSYHSIHDPRKAGTDLTWPTAQMTPELWETGCIMRKDGSYLQGFKGIGRKLSPLKPLTNPPAQPFLPH
ncbi:MAG: hypothetical protein PWP23_552 [Candidatus Sumerlaeota bacterium]|nr:hypothetical protein [Candidatus Sumerlaeota bacterium]